MNPNGFISSLIDSVFIDSDIILQCVWHWGGLEINITELTDVNKTENIWCKYLYILSLCPFLHMMIYLAPFISHKVIVIYKSLINKKSPEINPSVFNINIFNVAVNEPLLKSPHLTQLSISQILERVAIKQLSHHLQGKCLFIKFQTLVMIIWIVTLCHTHTYHEKSFTYNMKHLSLKTRLEIRLTITWMIIKLITVIRRTTE